MKTSYAFALLVAATSALTNATADLNFKVISQDNQRALRGADLGGTWGVFTQDGFCIEKIIDYENPFSNKVKFTECSNGNNLPSQMWKFDKLHPNERYTYGGLLYNMDGGCLTIIEDLTQRENLKVVECNKSNDKQHWVADGDTLSPREDKELCVAPLVHPVRNRDQVGLLDCDSVYSLDYFV